VTGTLAATGSPLRRYVPDRGAGRALALVTFIDSVGTGLFLAGAAVFYVRVIGLTAPQVGLSLSVAGAAGFATTVPIGVLGDRLGPRRLLVLLQLWRAACMVALVFVTGVVAFTVVAALMTIAETATPPLTQALVARVAGGDSRVRTMAVLRSTRNVGFAAGASLAAPLIAAGSVAAFSAIMFGDALSFVVAALFLALLRLPRAAGTTATAGSAAAARRRAGFWAVLGSFGDWRYASLAALNSVLALHLTLLVFGIPLWLIRATSAPAGLVAVLMLVNTAMAVVLQVPFSKHATRPGGALRLLRLAGVMLAGCSVAAVVAAHVPAGFAVALLVLATALMSLGEIWQAAGAWELSYRYADPEREVKYLAVFSLGGTAQNVFGPVLVTSAVIGMGTAGWLGLAALFLVVALLAGPVTSALDRAPRPVLARDKPDEPDKDGAEEEVESCCALTA
jgi:MFS family permease